MYCITGSDVKVTADSIDISFLICGGTPERQVVWFKAYFFTCECQMYPYSQIQKFSKLHYLPYRGDLICQALTSRTLRLQNFNFKNFVSTMECRLQ